MSRGTTVLSKKGDNPQRAMRGRWERAARKREKGPAGKGQEGRGRREPAGKGQEGRGRKGQP